MSEEDLDAVRTLFAAFADRDIEAAAKVLDERVEIRPGIVGGPEGETYRGPEGMGQFWADIDAAWAEFQILPEEFRELDAAILVLGRAFARGHASGVALDQGAAWIATLRNGLIVEFRSFSSPAEALDAAGLPREALD
jgi:ketosteroid isomerase-like protein